MNSSVHRPPADALFVEAPPGPDGRPQEEAPGTASFLRLCLRRPRASLALALCVAQVWLLHGAHIVRCRLRARLGCGGSDSGMTTAEYAVGTVAACGFAALLYKVEPVKEGQQRAPASTTGGADNRGRFSADVGGRARGSAWSGASGRAGAQAA